MDLGNRVVWVATGLALSLLGSGVGCSDDESSPPKGTGGSVGTGGHLGTTGGEMGPPRTGGAPGAGTGGIAEAGSAGTVTGPGGAAGGGAGGADGGGCNGPYEVLKSIAHSTSALVSWPELHRVGVDGSEGVEIYEVTGDGVELIETVGPQDLELGDDESIQRFAAYGKGLVVLVRGTDGQRLVRWDPEDGASNLLTWMGAEPARYLIASSASERVAVGSSHSAWVATETDGEWSWAMPILIPERYLTPLALLKDGVLLGIDEGYDAGSGGASSDSELPARVERWDLASTRTESYPSAGNPRMALELGNEQQSYLVAETNSFWGSYRAALERYDASGALVPLRQVPVISAADGEDGASDLAIVGEQLFVANCESGLLTTAAPDAESDQALPPLTPLEGPWTPDGPGDCSPHQVEAVDDVLVVGARTEVFFARLCPAP
jgi:hypothetical protein